MHNPGAGRGEHETEDLMALLAKAGHDARYQSTRDDECAGALAQPADVVIAAGGDGTVEKVARLLVGRGIPLSILPLGTANNLARTLGFHGSPEELISRLESGQRRRFDVGLARGPWGERRFFEGAGAGLLPDYMRAVAAIPEMEETAEALSKQQEVTRHVSLLSHMLPKYDARHWEIILDGEELSGSYLLVEAMNIRSIGPGLALAPQAETGDGQFDFVAVREGDRAQLDDYLAAHAAGKEIAFPISARRFRHLRLRWDKGAMLHFDDKTWPDKDERAPQQGEMEITIEPSALEVLLPA